MTGLFYLAMVSSQIIVQSCELGGRRDCPAVLPTFEVHRLSYASQASLRRASQPIINSLY